MKGRKIRQKFTKISSINYSTIIKNINCNDCHPHDVQKALLFHMKSMANKKEKTKSEDTIPEKPMFMAKHLIYNCKNCTFDGRENAKKHDRIGRETKDKLRL